MDALAMVLVKVIQLETSDQGVQKDVVVGAAHQELVHALVWVEVGVGVDVKDLETYHPYSSCPTPRSFAENAVDVEPSSFQHLVP
jgi:hypothetical protein